MPLPPPPLPPQSLRACAATSLGAAASVAAEGAERAAAEMEAALPQGAGSFLQLLSMHVEEGEGGGEGREGEEGAGLAVFPKHSQLLHEHTFAALCCGSCRLLKAPCIVCEMKRAAAHSGGSAPEGSIVCCPLSLHSL